MTNLKKDGCFRLWYNGYYFYLRGKSVDFLVFNSIFGNGEYDFNVAFKPEYIVDAGAFTGISALYFHKKYPQAKIIAVEPEGSNFDLLVRNTGPFRNIYPVRGGVFGEDISLAITDSDAEKYAFRLEECNGTGELVTGYTIRRLMREFQLPRIDILKMDIEGAEYSVFRNDPDSWLTEVRVLAMELHDQIHPGVRELVMNTMDRCGFQVSRRGENLIATRDNFDNSGDHKVSG